MNRSILSVKAGTLVHFEGTGLQILADLNEPEYGCQPYVTINTEDLAPEHRYDDETGARGNDAGPYWAADGENGETVVKDRGGQIAATFAPSFLAGPLAEQAAKLMNDRWRESAGMPIIAVDLNGATIFYDEGAGPIQREDTPKTDQLKALEAALIAIGKVATDRDSGGDIFQTVFDQLDALGLKS